MSMFLCLLVIGVFVPFFPDGCYFQIFPLSFACDIYYIYIYLTFSLLVASCVGTPIIPWMLYMCFCIFILNMTPMSANMSYMYGIGKWKRPDIFRISEVEQSFL